MRFWDALASDEPSITTSKVQTRQSLPKRDVKVVLIRRSLPSSLKSIAGTGKRVKGR